MNRSDPTPLPSPKERRRLREAQSLSQAQVAAQVGVSRETVRSWETGRTDPRGREREVYARLLTSAGPDTTATPAPAPEPVSASASATASVTDPVPERERVGALVGAGAAPVTAEVEADTSAAAPEDGEHGDDEQGEDLPDDAPLTALPSPEGLTPDQAFDALYAFTAPALVRQTYLLTGRRTLAQEAVERAFHMAWQRWPEVAVDRDPAGWVRAAAYEYAMSPWHRFRPGFRQKEAPPALPGDRALLDALLSLPPAYRRTLLLYDGVGLGLPETAAETEASTPAAANRLLHAREAVSGRLPSLADPAALHRGLEQLARGEKLQAPQVALVRSGCERRTKFWTRSAIAFTVLILGATALTLRSAPDHYDPPQAPGETVRGVPPRMGPGPLSAQAKTLRGKLMTSEGRGPERIRPEPR
ncbi:sigma factor-like helix-turn-helix DNA-binding protein [Streptomyces sp. NPDC091292]|uniref:sigma factor-like helix-turn-helix DNA-binding protein n=1 Tax=Streptomyces sp. NPDC091292 TaxID=3365991 RepID=UPI0037FAB341